MMRWIWAALCVTSTLWLVSISADWYVIAVNVVLDVWIVAGAMRGGR